MKILPLSHNFLPFIGGIEIISELLALAFVDAGHDVRVLTWSTDSAEKEFSFSVVRNPGLFRLLKEHAWADLIFENNPCLRLAWPTIFFRRPTVIALHTWLHRVDGKIGIQDQLKTHWWLKRAKKVIAVSDALRQRSWTAATIVGNPYRAHEFRIMPNVVKSEDFVFLGRLVSDKGANLAIEAIYHITKSITARRSLSSKPHLTIVGEGPERHALAQLAVELGVTDQVKFMGSLQGEALVECLNRHRFLLTPSIWEEPFGVVVLEALACGCIPIVSDGGGLPDAVGKAGLIFKSGDVGALVACVENVLSDPALEQQLLAAAPVHLSSFHPKVVTRKYLDIIEAAVLA